MAGKRQPMSTAERALRKHTKAAVKRVESGDKIHAALGAAGYTPRQVRSILLVADGGEQEIVDEGYRRACEQLARKLRTAMSEQTSALAARWHELAVNGDDWRSIAELLRRRDPDEWAVTERSEVSVDADVRTEGRSEDAVLAALARLTGGAPADGDT